MQKVVDESVTLQHLVPLFTTLLTDRESEVRAVVAANLFNFSQPLPAAHQHNIILTQIIPAVEVINEYNCVCDSVWGSDGDDV